MTESPAIRPLGLSEFAHVKDERLRALLSHWFDRRGSDLAPMRTAIDPAAIAPLLSGVWMCDYYPMQRRFRMRLSGEDINLLYGRNVSNCFFEDIIVPAMLPDVMRRYQRVVEEPSIMHCYGQIYMSSGRSVVGERLVLPLADESGAIMHVIGASLFRLDPYANDGRLAKESMIETFTALTTLRSV